MVLLAATYVVAGRSSPLGQGRRCLGAEQGTLRDELSWAVCACAFEPNAHKTRWKVVIRFRRPDALCRTGGGCAGHDPQGSINWKVGPLEAFTRNYLV